MLLLNFMDALSHAVAFSSTAAPGAAMVASFTDATYTTDEAAAGAAMVAAIAAVAVVAACKAMRGNVGGVSVWSVCARACMCACTDMFAGLCECQTLPINPCLAADGGVGGLWRECVAVGG